MPTGIQSIGCIVLSGQEQAVTLPSFRQPFTHSGHLRKHVGIRELSLKSSGLLNFCCSMASDSRQHIPCIMNRNAALRSLQQIRAYQLCPLGTAVTWVQAAALQLSLCIGQMLWPVKKHPIAVSRLIHCSLALFGGGGAATVKIALTPTSPPA
jgi:hypothetical protein